MSRRNVLPLALLGGGIAYWLAVRPWHLRWGATDAEAREALPGDERVPQPKSQVTHAITIHAPAVQVWPWLAQIGQNRGGFYSYAWLENLAGCHMRNAEQIVPEWQPIEVGDKVWLHPKAPPLPVVLVEPGRALVFGSNTEEPGTWGLYLKELDAHTTRLLVRGRGGNWIPGLLGQIAQYALFEPAHFIMERKMLLGIKQRAEVMARQHEKALASSAK